MVRVEQMRGRARLDATTKVLQRARSAAPTGGVWEAADVQWWWRRPRVTDDMPLPVWSDGAGPCGAVSLVEWDDRWQADIFGVPGTVGHDAMFESLIDLLGEHGPATVEAFFRDDDPLVTSLLAHGFNPSGEAEPIMWMNGPTRPSVDQPPKGCAIFDRASTRDRPHPMAGRNGEHVESRLHECSLYDPELDLGAATTGGDVAGYALFWMDSTTGVGMLEPMRVEDAYQGLGLARALLTAGLDRLAQRGAARIKVTFARYAGSADLGGEFTTAGAVRAFTRTTK